MEIKAWTFDTMNLPFALLGKPSTEKKNHDLALTGVPLLLQSLTTNLLAKLQSAPCGESTVFFKWLMSPKYAKTDLVRFDKKHTLPPDQTIFLKHDINRFRFLLVIGMGSRNMLRVLSRHRRENLAFWCTLMIFVGGSVVMQLSSNTPDGLLVAVDVSMRD